MTQTPKNGDHPRSRSADHRCHYDGNRTLGQPLQRDAVFHAEECAQHRPLHVPDADAPHVVRRGCPARGSGPEGLRPAPVRSVRVQRLHGLREFRGASGSPLQRVMPRNVLRRKRGTVSRYDGTEHVWADETDSTTGVPLGYACCVTCGVLRCEGGCGDSDVGELYDLGCPVHGDRDARRCSTWIARL